MSAALVPGFLFDSADFPPEERFVRWRGLMAGMYDTTPRPDPARPFFEVQASGWHLGSLVVGAGRYTDQHVARTPAMVRRDQIDHYKIVVRDDGPAEELDADGRHVLIPPGSVVLKDLSRPEQWDSTGVDTSYVFIARDALDDLLPAPLGRHGEVLRSGTAGLLADHVRSLARHLPRMTPAEVPDVVEATLRLIAACLAPSVRSIGDARPALEATLVRQMCRYVELHLEDTELDAEAIGKAFRCSRSTLYRLFAPFGGVHAFVKERRLARAEALLRDATTPVHLGRLADRLAFKSGSHFSREFKARFGHAPSECRDHDDAPSAPVAMADADQPFARWMQSARG